MHRRTFLLAVAGGTSLLGGCLSDGGDPLSESTTASPDDDPSTDSTTSHQKGSETATPIRYTNDGVSASFQVTDSHTPTDDTASATFDGPDVTVTGTMDPSGCNRPELEDVQYNETDAVLHVSIGGASPYGETATVECDNASYDYRCSLTVDSGQPEAVEIVHAYEGKDPQSFNLVRN